MLSCLSVVFMAPTWIEILLARGTMAELPLARSLLSGVALIVFAFDDSNSIRRRALFVGAASCSISASWYHAVGWVYIAAIPSCIAVA
jgi:hypothetical protein